MNRELISKITGKEYYILTRIMNLTSADHGIIMANKTITYRDGKYNKFSITYKGQGSVSKGLIKEHKDDILITDIISVFDNAELFIKNNLINVYKDYKFTIRVCDKYLFDINAKLIELDEVSATDGTRLNEIKSLYNKIKSISLVDNTIFKSDTVILGDWKINVLFNYVGSVDLTEVIYKGITKLYSDGMTAINPIDSDK